MDKLGISLDYNTTREYRFKYESQCDCAYCKNYFETFKEEYQEITSFIESFGLDTSFPLEIMPLEFDKKENKMGYISYYPIKGSMDEYRKIFQIEGLEVRILKGSNNNPCPNPKMSKPYLLLEVSGIKLPWILNEEIE